MGCKREEGGSGEGGREECEKLRSYWSCSYLVDNAASHSHSIQNGDLHISMVHISLLLVIKIRNYLR